MHQRHPDPLRAAARRWLEASAPERVLVVGAAARALLADAEQPVPAPCVVAVDAPTVPLERWFATLPAEARFDAAFLSDLARSLGEDEAATVLGRVRDLHAARVLLLTEAGTGVRADLLALGMERVAGVEGELALYAFDLDRYKRTPDWLNPRYWANPQNWGKYRW